MKITEHITNFLEKNQIDISSKFIIGVSGGSDSMACLTAFKKLNLNIICAHVNFKLRDNESDQDEIFVANYCKNNQIPFYSKAIDCKIYCIENKLSTQEGAREIRYNFFNELLTQLEADFIVTAHHLEDQSETVLLNLIRGTGSKGIIGIPEIRDCILRPLLSATKKEILGFLEENSINYRTDSSNLSNAYNRNFLRNKVLPDLAERFPNLFHQINKTSLQVNQDYNLLDQLANEKLPIKTDETFSFELKLLNGQNRALIYHQLRKLNFSETQVDNMIISKRSGAIFETNSHSCTLTNESVIVQPIENNKRLSTLTFHSLEDIQTSTYFSQVEILNRSEITSLKVNQTTALIDIEKVSFPLSLRTWKNGDTFQPLGMKGQKKVSDFLNDIKINNLEKKNIQVLISGNEIIWIINHRLANSIKINNNTKKVLKLVTHF